MREFSVKNYLRSGLKLPFCPGCGAYTIIDCFLKAVFNLGYNDLRKFVFCSGIGCSAWIPSPYFNADSIHTPHGRAIPVATAVKLIRPELNVVVFGGDGDIAGIGGNHLIHAARRNVDITVIMVNNMVYGMTGGQVAPTTPLGYKTTTTPKGCFEYPIDAVKLVSVLGASYAARWTTAHKKELIKAFEEAIESKGFSFVEVISQCPTNFGRRINLRGSAEMLKWFKENSVSLEEAEKLGWDKVEGKFVVGVFARKRRPTLAENMRRAASVG